MVDIDTGVPSHTCRSFEALHETRQRNACLVLNDVHLCNSCCKSIDRQAVLSLDRNESTSSLGCFHLTEDHGLESLFDTLGECQARGAGGCPVCSDVQNFLLLNTVLVRQCNEGVLK